MLASAGSALFVSSLLPRCRGSRLDAETRSRAADSLRSDEANGVPPAAVPDLLKALASEPDPVVRSSLLLTLGRSGAPDAKAPIDDALIEDPDPHVRRAAKRALAYWSAQNDGGPSANARYWIPGWQPASKVGH